MRIIHDSAVSEIIRVFSGHPNLQYFCSHPDRANDYSAFQPTFSPESKPQSRC